MLESYVTPLLMSYVNKYIKNLKPSDLQLSLWGGDVVLSKLDLKLDVLEQELKLPFTFMSGHIHELRIHVPWTKLGSEPVVITINTMECILKLKDGAQDDHDSCSSSTSRSVSDGSKSTTKPRRLQQAAPSDPDLPPGYVQSLIRRVVNNVNIVVNNLILKYVEDDIVLSVNITAAECYTVDDIWERAFMDITAPELVLRKVINFADCTVCLDKRNASGKIEFYQDPLLYKCSFRTRLHFTYDNINSKIPSVIKIHTMVESLKLSITDQQLPMFIRILELIIALYYGEIGGHKESEGEEGTGHVREGGASSPGTDVEMESLGSSPYSSQDLYTESGSPEDPDQGWMSWAWSFVPAIVGAEEEGEGGLYMQGDTEGISNYPQQHTLKDPIVSIGFYCTKASITFKLTDTQSESSYYSPQKVKSREVLCMEQEGITIEVLMMGEPFFNCQIGFVGCRALCLKGIMGVRDFEENLNRREEDAVFFNCGDNLKSKGMTYLTNSLFDYRSPENNGVKAEFILDSANHKESYTEIAGMQRFGAFYMDYLYTMENSSSKGSQDISGLHPEELVPAVQETSMKRLVVGPLDIRLHSSAAHRILKMITCAMDHEYEPYCKPQQEAIEASHGPVSPEEISRLEEFIPTRLTSVTLLQVSVTVSMAEFNLLHTLIPVILGYKATPRPVSVPVVQPVHPLPSMQFQVERVNFDHSVPMYGPELVSTVSSLSQPPDNLLHHCYSHLYLKVFGFQAGLTCQDRMGSFLPLISIIPSFSTAIYGKLIQLPAYWSKRSSVPTSECIFELPHFAVQATRPQTLLLQAICQSWTHSMVNGSSVPISESLLNEVFKAPGVKYPGPSPTLEGLIQNLELKFCSRAMVKCASGTVGAVKVCARTPGSEEGKKEKLVPLIQGPSDTKELHMSRWLNEIRKPESLLAPDLLAFSVQVPQQGDDCRNSGAVLLVSVQGIAVNVDPIICTWLLYQPHRGSSRKQQQNPGPVPLVKRREDEVSVGSAPLAKQPSNPASDYASSPMKTKTVTESRPMSIPMKVIPETAAEESWTTSEERMKELFSHAWDAVKRLTLQLDLQSCCVFLPNDSLPSPSTIICGDIPGTVRSWYHNQASMPGTLVVCLPQISVLSAGHKYMEPLQELPFVVSKPILEEGDAFPWTISLGQFSVYTLLGKQQSLSLLEPMGCTSTLAVTSKLQGSSEERPSFVVCLHVDLQPVHVKSSNSQVQLLYEIFLSWSCTWARLQKHGILRQTSSIPDPPAGAAPSSPVRSSAGTALPDTSTCSPSADFGSPTEGDSVPAGDDGPFADTVTLEQKTSSIEGTSGKVSLWMQWMLPKVTIQLFAADPTARKTEICVLSELEDLSASVDIQDVYTKIKCKVGSFNIDHYRCSMEEGVRTSDSCGGVVLSCTDKLNRRTVLVRPVSKQSSFSHFSGFSPPMAAKILEGSHQQHGFLSITYTQAVTKNVRHKLTSRLERPSRSSMTTPSQRTASDPLADSSPQYLREILLTAQPFDVVLFCPLLATVAGVFQTTVPRRYRERGKSAGQPMRSHTLTSRCLPLIYINTSVIRVFCHGTQDRNAASESSEKKEDTLVLKLGSLSMAPQADNPLTRTVLRKDIYQRALNLGILRDPGSEVEDRQYQIDLQSINIGTALWEQLKPEKEGAKGGASAESERSSQNPALEWNMASSIRRQQERRAILTPILTDFSVRVTAAPAIIFSKNLSLDGGQTEEVVVCGHSLEVNVTSNLDFYLSVAQVQLLQQLLRDNLVGSNASEKGSEVRRQEQKGVHPDPLGSGDSSSRHSGTGQDSGFGSDSTRIRIVQIEQQSGTSHHCIARPSRKSTITKNLTFIPFDIFLTASKLSVMTYACSSTPKALTTLVDTPSTPEKKEPEDKVGKSILNHPEIISDSPPVSPSPTPDQTPAAQGSLAGLTADDILNSNTSQPPSPLIKGSLLSLDGLPTPTRSSARQALGVTIVRQPGRRGTGDQVLEPLLYVQLMQPSVLLSCHHRKQKMELSVFDVALRGVPSDYKCQDPGKTLPETLDYNVCWVQTVSAEVDSKTGVPPPLLCFQIKDFLNGPAELNVELCRPLKISPTLMKMEQAKAYLQKVLPNYTWESSSKTPSAFSTPHSSPKKSEQRAFPPRLDPHHEASALGRASPATSLTFHKVSLHTAQIVVVMETEACPMKPSVTVSVSAMTSCLTMKTGPRIDDPVESASVLLTVKDALVKTGLRDRGHVFLGPFSCSSSLEARWCRHSGSPGPEPGPPKLLLDLKGGLLQVFWGQEHLNCLMLVEEHLRNYLHLHKEDSNNSWSKGKACHTQPPPSPVAPSPRTEHSSDDLRTGNFQYIQDSGSQKLPGPHEVVFYSETEDSPGVMLWRYPEPRVLTFVRITPVPFNTTEDPEISTADLGDVLQVPCSLEYWDELQQAFVPYREFSLSESCSCQLQLPSLSLTDQQKELVASDLWRIVLNHNGEGGDEQSSDSECGSQLPCDQLVSPLALAACTRVDSCFAPWFVPSLGVSLQLAQLEVHLCHHLEQLGTVASRKLHPFLPDRKLPQEQEFMVIGSREPQVFMRQWSNGPRHCQEMSFSTRLDCRLLEYRNLTHLQLLQSCALQGQATAISCPQNSSLTVNVFVDPMFLNISQYAIHTVDTALLSWQQNGNQDAEELLYSHYVICNDTNETLRFGQVDTDENVLLASLHSHQYSWRSHKSPQLLHICIEGWGNWRWSEPFSVDNVGTLLRTIQYKGRTASLIIKVLQLNGVQKQIIICGRQVMCSYLTQDIELRVVQHYVGADSQTVVREHCDCLEAGAKLPSYVLEDAEMTELCMRARGDEDWSQDVELERREKGSSSSSVVQVACSSGSLLYVWCTLITVEPDSHMQQRLVIFSPLFVMRSHLPEPLVVHIEKRSLGLKETQLIPGQGHQEPLLNTEAELTHHLIFQAREDKDASHCAVPISTGLIKQIMNKTGNEDNPEHILADFYGPKTTTESPWPYVTKDTDRSALEPLAQWDSPMQVKLSQWKPGLNTLLVELLPWALMVNDSQWDLWLFEGETIVLQIPAGKVIVPPNFKEAFQIGIYWAHTNTVHKSTALKLVHDLTSPRWKEGTSSVVVTLDEEGYVEVDISLGAFPGKQKVCQFCVSSVVRHGVQILQIEDRTILVNNTPYSIHYRPLLTNHALGGGEQFCEVPESTVFTIPPSDSLAKPCSVPCWDLLQPAVQGSVEFPLPLRHMLFSLVSKPDAGAADAAWSLPAPVRPDLPRQSLSIPVDQDCGRGLCSRAIVLAYQEHLGVTYITLNEDPCPRMLVENRCPVPLLLKENVKETPRSEVFCRPLPADSSLHHELYHHFSSFPECRQRELLPTLQLKTRSDKSATDWTDPIDINCPGTQVVFLPGFGCLYVHVAYERGTLVLSLAPEGGVEAVINQHNKSSKLSVRILLSEASVVISDDITNPSGSMELLRLTLTKLLLSLGPAPASLPPELAEDSTMASCSLSVLMADASLIEVYCYGLQVDNQLYNRTSFHFPVLLCQDQRGPSETGGAWSIDVNPGNSPEGLEEFKRSCFLQLRMTLTGDRRTVEEVNFQLQPARVYIEDTFVYYIKTLFDTYIPSRPAEAKRGREPGALIVPEQMLQSVQALVHPVRLQRLSIQPVHLLVSIHASLKLYIASDHTPLSFSVFERGPVFTTARQLVHALAMHYAAGALFRAGWVVGSLEILGSPASLVLSIGNGVSDFFRLPYEGLTRGPGAFVSGVSRGTTSFVKHISKGTLTSITNLATSLARNMDRLSLDEEHYTRQEEWRRQLPESLGDGLRQGLSRLGISLLGAVAGIVDQPMQNFQKNWETQSSAGSKAKGVISGVGKGIVGVFTKPIGGAAELVSQTGYGILHGAGLWQLPKQLYLPAEEKSALASNSHLKYVWKMLQSLGRPELHMALEVTIVSGSGQEHAGCLLLTSEVLFVVSLCEDTQQQAFPITEVECQQEPEQPGQLTLTLQQQTLSSDSEGDGVRERLSEQQYQRLVDYVSRASQFVSLSAAALQLQPPVTLAEPPPSVTKCYRYLVDPAFAKVFVSKFTIVKNKALRIGFH
ncbi:vacuolar protein sorting-associated protein 13B isoform X1 [Xiphophorus couchianus]|uniref:vacuolar protein sorting-associated protein 13B isoform X1 n=1 Tax=Xiphophorus couchianus TaxID=32473 RepID=UPI001016413F|nr:vacuolar protein sorting-associated protein 13B isoform X1 [Xiphophorus couchianus]XP_027872493.1 vacuolar protein sorting-associated protein 13B isoform X1 [Xiphophorus couchianus]